MSNTFTLWARHIVLMHLSRRLVKGRQLQECSLIKFWTISWRVLMNSKKGILERIFGRSQGSEKFMLVPAYDKVTSKTSEWVSSWGIPEIVTYEGVEVSHNTVAPLLNSSSRSIKL